MGLFQAVIFFGQIFTLQTNKQTNQTKIKQQQQQQQKQHQQHQQQKWNDFAFRWFVSQNDASTRFPLILLPQSARFQVFGVLVQFLSCCFSLAHQAIDAYCRLINLMVSVDVKHHVYLLRYSEHVGKMTDTRKQKAEKASSIHCSRGTCRSDSRFPQLVVWYKL